MTGAGVCGSGTGHGTHASGERSFESQSMVVWIGNGVAAVVSGTAVMRCKDQEDETTTQDDVKPRYGKETCRFLGHLTTK